MTRELLVAAVAVAGLAGLISVMGAGSSNAARIDAPTCNVAGKVVECGNADFSLQPPRPVVN
jgi:hypothetical protein